MKKIWINFALVIILSIVSTFPIMANDTISEDEIRIDILYSELSEDEIVQIVLEDGSQIGDYNYSINYISVPEGIGNTAASPLSNDNPGGSWGGYFQYVAWITRSTGPALSLIPTSAVRQSWTTANSAWNILTSNPTISQSPNWRNTQCLFWQYKCHFNFANNKTTWNLDVDRTASSYAGVVASGCNP